MATTGNSFGYFAGGYSAGQSVVDRIDYSNDTATASPKGPLSQSSRGFVSATGNSNFGYVCGGYPHGTKVDRIDYK